MSHADNNKVVRDSIIFAVILIAATAAVILWALHGAREARRAGHDSEVIMHATSEPALVKGADNPSKAPPRVAWARDWQRKMRAKARTLSARATEEEHRTLELGWTQQNLDRRHMEQLKQQEPFFHKLAALGFRKLVMTVDGERIWERPL